MTNLSLKQAIDDFWALSVAFYESTSPSLLELQNNHGVNVNRLLFCLWFGYRQKRLLLTSEIDLINQYCKPIERFIEQVRQLRFDYQKQFEKPYSNSIEKQRKRLLACELSLEKKHQQWLLWPLLADPHRLTQLPLSQIYGEALSSNHLPTQVLPFKRDRTNLLSLCGSLQHESSCQQAYEMIIKRWYRFLSKII